jgi:WD40 repeat protein
MRFLVLSIFSLFLFTACSSKQYFEPEDTQDYNASTASIQDKIKTFNASGATLENGYFISKQGLSKQALPQEFEFLNVSNNKVLSSNNKDSMMINEMVLKLDEVVVAASLQEDTLALVLSDNTIAIYDLQTKEFVFKEYFKESVANDIRISNPFFMNNLILFPTLDGKVLVVSKQENKIVKNIVVDPDSTFNNIIFLNVINDTLIAASNNKLIAVGTGTLNIKDYEIKEITVSQNHIFVATIDGQIIKLDLQLNEIASKKYKFAKFFALNYTNALYALESQGYLIKIDEDFINDIIYDFSFDNEAKAISIGNKIYFDNKVIEF